MKQEQFIYRVEINVTMTGADLANLYNVASNHYDAKCKALAKPARPGGRETDGWLHGLMSRFTGEHVLDRSPDFSHTPEGNAEACRANPELTFQVTLNHGLLDTLCKTMEMARGEDECATAWGLMEAFASLRKQAATSPVRVAAPTVGTVIVPTNSSTAMTAPSMNTPTPRSSLRDPPCSVELQSDRDRLSRTVSSCRADSLPRRSWMPSWMNLRSFMASFRSGCPAVVLRRMIFATAVIDGHKWGTGVVTRFAMGPPPAHSTEYGGWGDPAHEHTFQQARPCWRI